VEPGRRQASSPLRSDIGMKKTYQILVADDEPAVRQVLRDLIVALGQEYTVYTAADSHEALHMIQTLPLDLALVDIFMPGLDGFGLIREIRSKNPYLMIVVITGQPSYNMVLEALRLGASDFLAKPVSLAELRKILGKLKGRSQPGQTAVTPVESPPPARSPKGLVLPEQNFLRVMSEKLAEVRTPRELYAFLTDMALSLSGGTGASFFLYDQEQGRLQLVSHCGNSHGKLSGCDLANNQPVPDPALLDRDITGNSTASCFSIPIKIRGELLGILHVGKPSEQHFTPEVIDQLHLLADRFVLTLENLTLQESVFTNLYDTLRTLINSLEARDSSTRHHSVRVTSIAARFAEKIGLPAPLVDSLRRAGPLHDIGKIGIPDAVLLKPGPLIAEEMEIIRQHPVIGANIVEPLHLLPREQAIILHHHERWDGRGYPHGLAGEDIPFLCRIIALADSYDAMISERVYRPRLSHDQALAEIAVHAGSQFDPDLARQFIQVMSRPLAIKEIQSLDSELAADQPFLSTQRFQEILKTISHKIIFPKGGKKSLSIYHN